MTQPFSSKIGLIHRLGICSMVVPLAQPLAAQSWTWTGASGPSWANLSNWNPGTLPTPGADITIADTTNNSVGNLSNENRSVGTITFGTTGTRTSAFGITTTTANTLTINGGFISNGNYTAGIGPRIRGNTTLSASQTWQIGGQPGSAAADRGVALNEVASSGVAGTVLLDGNLNKSGSGQLTVGGVNVSGAGHINVNEGSLKLNAGGSLPLTVSGTGKIIVNNSGMLLISRNSGTFNVTRSIQMNNTAGIETGTGSTGLTTSSDIASDIEFTGTHTITNSTNSGGGGVPFRLTGVLSGGSLASVTKTGGSQLVLTGTGANTFSGQLTVAGGELALDKTGVNAVAGNILITGGNLRKLQGNQIADSSSITVTGGAINYNAATPDTIAALTISSGATSSISGFNVTGATTISGGTHQLNSGETFTTNSLAISNNAAVQLVGAATLPASSTIHIGSGGLTLDTGRILYGNPGNASTTQVNLSGDVLSTGTSLFSAANYNGERILDLQGGSRTFTVDSGTLDIRTTIRNGTLVKAGAGTLILSRTGSTADYSFTEGDVTIATQANAGNVTHSAGALRMDIGGFSPVSLTTSGNFTSTGGTIELTAANGPISPGLFELVRYQGSLIGTPTVNIPPSLVASRMNPVIDYGTGTDSAITVTTTALPLSLTWRGSAAGGLWDNATTANFNGGSESFYSLDTVVFDDSGLNPSIVLNATVTPTDVIFDHGNTVGTYTLTGIGTISGPTKLTKLGTGTTIIATDNDYTGGTDILDGTLRVGNGGFTGSLGSGPVQVSPGATLGFARDGLATVPNVITGTGDITASGPGTVALTANSGSFAGNVFITGGTLQFGNGGADGSLASAPISVSAGATFAIQRTGTPTVANPVTGAGRIAVIGGSPILTGFNDHTGGLDITQGGVVRTPSDTSLGQWPLTPVADSIRLDHGGLKNQDSFTVVDAFRGISITGEAYFTAGWSKSLTIAGPITGTGDVFVNYDSGTVVFSDPTSTWNGVLTLGASRPGFTGTTGGILEIDTFNNGGQPGPLGISSASPANLVFNGGRINYTGVSATSNRGFTLQGAGTLQVGFDTLTLSGQVTGTGNLTKAGAGTLVLSGNSDFVGEKIISAGTLVAASTTALGDTASFVRFTGTTGILDLATDTSIAPHALTIGVGNSGTILTNVATPGNPGINHTLGNADLSRVTLNVAAGANVTGGDPRLTLPTLGLTAGDAGTTTLAPTTANLNVGDVTIPTGNAAKTLALGGTSQDNHVTGAISDGINITTLTKVNTSQWTLSGDSTFTGNVTVDNGLLAITHSNALGAASKTLIIAGDAGANRIPEVQLRGGISPTIGNLQISGAGVANLTGALRNFSGNNTLNVTGQVTMRTGNGNTTLYSDSGTLTLNTPLVTANATNRQLSLAGPGNGVINGVIANGSTANLPVTKIGTGTWTLNGAHTYTGTTTVSEGTLSLGQAALSDSAAVVIASGAVLNLDFTGTDRVGSLTIGVNPPLADGLYNATTHPGVITGSGSLRVGPEPSGYGTWAASFPFTPGVNDGENDDPDGDGIPNLLEYVLGGTPIGAGASDTSILPVQSLTDTHLLFTFRRSDASEADVSLQVQWSATLGGWTDFATIGPVSSLPQVTVVEDSPTAALDTVTVAVPRSLAPGGKLFVRLQATK